jgi:cobalamin biosynthesis protein CobD/CbiB
VLAKTVLRVPGLCQLPPDAGSGYNEFWAAGGAVGDMIGHKSLSNHARPVAKALAQSDLAEARRQLALIVSREIAHSSAQPRSVARVHRLRGGWLD